MLAEDNPEVIWNEQSRVLKDFERSQFLLLGRFDVKNGMNDSLHLLKPILEELGVLRIVDQAKDDAGDRAYWVNVFSELSYASDIIISVTNGTSKNVEFEQMYLFKQALTSPSIYDLSPLEGGFGRHAVLGLCRAGRIDITITKRIIRKGRVKVCRYSRDHWNLHVDNNCDVNELRRAIGVAILKIRRQQYFLWQSFVDANTDFISLLEYYQHMKTFILSDLSIKSNYSMTSEYSISKYTNNAHYSEVYELLKEYRQDLEEMRSIPMIITLFDNLSKANFGKLNLSSIKRVLEKDNSYSPSAAYGLLLYYMLLMVVAFPFALIFHILSIPFSLLRRI